MKANNQTSIAYKLRKSMLQISTIALVIATVGFVSLEYFSYRDALLQRIKVLADFIAINSTATLVFDDTITANKLLSSLQAEQSINTAILMRQDYSVLASYPLSETGASALNQELPSKPVQAGES